MKIANFIPKNILLKMIDVFSFVFYILNVKQVKQYRENMKIAGKYLGFSSSKIEKIVKEGIKKTFKYYVEVFTFENDLKNLDNLIEINGIKDAIKTVKKKGVVIPLFHSGNQYLGAGILGNFSKKNVSVIENLNDDEINNKFLELGKSVNLKLIFHNDRPVLEKLEKYVNQKYLAVLLAERNMSKRGVKAKLFGKNILASAGPALLVKRCNAKIMPAHIYYCKNCKKYKVNILKPLNIKKSDSIEKITQNWISALEKPVGKHLEDWHILQKIFV
jgi:lauroyl/myristoyl acyltransferase